MHRAFHLLRKEPTRENIFRCEATDVRLPSAVIETFLRNHPEPYCVDCLSRKLDIPAGQVSMVMRRLEDSWAFSVVPGDCAYCRRRVSVIKIVAAG